MMDCWKEEPEERPTFDSLCDVIRSLETHSGQVRSFVFHLLNLPWSS